MTTPRDFRFWLALAITLLFFAAPEAGMAARAKARTKVAAAGEIISVYSDLCTKMPDGDLLGQRLFLFESGSDYYVLLQTAQGELMRPDLGEATVKDGEIRFQIQRGAEARLSFKGKITPALITGRFSDGRIDHHKSKVFHFKRQANRKIPAPPCGKY